MTNNFMQPIFEEAVRMEASDIYLTCGALPSIRVKDRIMSMTQYQPMTADKIREAMEEILSPEQVDEFQATLELNAAYLLAPGEDSRGQRHEGTRFRVNVFQQQQQPGMVIRRVRTDIPTLESLQLPALYGNLIMEKRGLILIVGPTGSGKTTSMAAMIGHRNKHGGGHIVTVEDPIEFVHTHDGCIITQRDIGIDTYSFAMALKNALRQRPDVVLIGEIRDRDTMEHALTFAETGHLCLATLHANNSNQAIERILNFFPEEKHAQVLQGLSMNIRAILSQRLVETYNHDRAIAIEIMLNEGLVRQLIEEGKVKELKEVIEKNVDQGMQSFDQALFELARTHVITEETAVAEADNPANMKLRIRQAHGLPGIRSAPEPTRPLIVNTSGATGF